MKTDKKLGQHWLVDGASLKAMCVAGEVAEGDKVLEVGPGLGALTQLLLEAGANVTSVEFDKRLIEGLEDTFGADKFKLVEGDILQFNLRSMGDEYKVVANIPYYLTSKLLRKLLEAENKPKLITLLVQKEVAERIAAKPGSMSTLSISAQFYAEVDLREVVPARFFEPAPKVDSQIIVLRPRSRLLFDVDVPKFFRMVKSGFGERRKKLANSMAGGLRMDKDEARDLVENTGLEQNVRAQELSLEQWKELYNKLYN